MIHKILQWFSTEEAISFAKGFGTFLSVLLSYLGFNKIKNKKVKPKDPLSIALQELKEFKMEQSKTLNEIKEEIKHSVENLDKLNHRIDNLEKKFDTRISKLEGTLEEIQNHFKTEKFKSIVKHALRDKTSEFIRYNGLKDKEDGEMITLILQGRDETILLSNELIDGNIFNIDEKELHNRIIASFDKLRLIAERYLSVQFVENLKSNSKVYTHIEMFKHDLLKISKKMYNGNSEKAFVDTMETFMLNMFISGIEIYNKK